MTDNSQGRDNSQPSSSLKRLTRERFKEEVARELGIDLTSTGFPRREINQLEQDFQADHEPESGS